MSVARVRVALPDRPYDVVVGPGVLRHLSSHLTVARDAANAAVITVEPVATLYGSRVVAALQQLGLETHTIVVPDGEAAKTLATLDAVYHRLAAIPLGRSDVVVALGGGVAGDLAGFAAATWNRGVAVIQLPTTLLAQVDAAVGGKTGVNLPEGKNLIGAFHQPSVVVADTETLATLALRDRRAGLGEAAKYGFIEDTTLLELLESRPEAAVDGDSAVISEVVRRGVSVKARIVAADERETGERALLNYGHTFAHAIEAVTGYGTYRHGEAVALGMVAAARLGERLGVSDRGLAQRTVSVLQRLGLPTAGVRADPAQLWDAMTRDKKAKGGVRFVLCTRPGHAVVVDPPERHIVDGVLRSLG
ncbi:MAG: 3-dehydroquinate synthase [Nitriliruptorales bacterium]|nr:3-dehydroquinate synthase [Nitriliruptorales bacterium]